MSDTRYLAWTSWVSPQFVALCLKGHRVCLPVGLACLSALLLLVTFFVLLYRRCTTKESCSSDVAACVLYCLLGDLSSTVGAVLSNQLDLQVLMGMFMTALDVVNFSFIFFPICFCWQSNSARRMRIIMRRRRRQNLLAVSLPLTLGMWFFFWFHPDRVPAEGAHSRRLLEVSLTENGDVPGYMLGLLSLVIGWSSKFPVLAEAHRGKISSGLHMSYGVLCVVANTLYASAILVYDTHLEHVQKALPWLLTSAGCATLDIVIVTLSYYRKQKGQQAFCQHKSRTSPDAQCLLGSTSCAVHHPRGTTAGKHHGCAHIPLQKLCGSECLNRKNDDGRYMDINIQPARKISLKEVKMCQESQSRNQPLKRTVVQLDSTCSSDSSSVYSDLEDWTLQSEGNPPGCNVTKTADEKTCADVCDCDTAVQKGGP
ncbi:transmembrane protein 44 isoform X2 [Arapaima gigas]